MSTTPGRNLNERQREIDELERRRTWYAGGGSIPFWWAWFLVIVLCFFWFAGWGWGSYGGWWWGHRIVAEIPAVTGTGVAVLNSADKASYVGEHINLQNVPVQRKVNNTVLWIGRNNPPTLLVLPGSNGNAPANNVRMGDRITVTGQVQKAPAANLAQQDWKLSNNGVTRLEKEQAYVQAQQLNIDRYER